MRLMILLLIAYLLGNQVQILLGFPTSPVLVMWWSIAHSFAQLLALRSFLMSQTVKYSRFRIMASLFCATVVLCLLPGMVMEDLAYKAISIGIYSYSRGCMGNPLTFIPFLVVLPVGIVFTILVGIGVPGKQAGATSTSATTN